MAAKLQQYAKEIKVPCRILRTGQRNVPDHKRTKHGPAPSRKEGQWVKAYKIEGYQRLHRQVAVGWCRSQQGTLQAGLNIKNGIIEEALVETIICSPA